MYPLTGSLKAPNGIGRQALPGIGIGVCIPLEVEVKAADDDYRKAAYIQSTSPGLTPTHML